MLNQENHCHVSISHKYRESNGKRIAETCLVRTPAQSELCRWEEGGTTSSPQLMPREWGRWMISSALYWVEDVPTKHGYEPLHT